MEKKIEICIGTDRTQTVRARLSLLLIENGRVSMEHYHSTTLAPGDDLTATRKAIEAGLANPNSGLPSAPWPSIPDAEWSKVEQICAVLHTPEVVAAAQKARFVPLPG